MVKKVLVPILIFLLYIFPCGQNAVFGQNADDFEFKKEKTGITVTGYKGSDKTVAIPEKLSGLPVVKIGYQAFAFKHLTAVSIPDSVTHIETGAFYNNQLSRISLPGSLRSIGDVAFSFNRITGVVIPDSVKTIGMEAFSENRLVNVTLPANVDIKINSFYLSLFDKYVKGERKKAVFSITLVMSNQYELAILDEAVVEIIGFNGNEKELILPSSINGIPVTAIGDRVFCRNQLTSVIIPNSVQIIGDDAFIHNKLTNVVLPNSLRIIGNGAFVNNEISNLVLPDFLVSIGNAAFTSNKITELVLPDSLVSIGFAAFSSNRLTNVVIPSSIKSLGDHVFDNSVKVKKAIPLSNTGRIL